MEASLQEHPQVFAELDPTIKVGYKCIIEHDVAYCFSFQSENIKRIDLSSGKVDTYFSLPETTWVGDLDIDNDHIYVVAMPNGSINNNKENDYDIFRIQKSDKKVESLVKQTSSTNIGLDQNHIYFAVTTEDKTFIKKLNK